MASTEKTPVRAKAAHASQDETANGAGEPHETMQAGDQAGAADDARQEHGAAEAVHELTDSLGRAWSEARGTVNDLGANLGRRARNVREEARSASFEARETLSDAAAGMAELGEEIAEDAVELGRALGVSVSRFVRKHPIRSVAIAAAAGAVLARLLRSRRRD